MTALDQSAAEQANVIDLAGVLAPPRLSAVMDEPGAGTVLQKRPGHRARFRPVLRPAAIYLVSRLVVLSSMSVAAAVAHRTLAHEVNTWDSKWFIRAAGMGWPSRLPLVHGHVAGNTTAFFPVFPLLFRWLSHLTGMSLLAAGAVVSSLTGLTAMIAVWMLVREYAGSRAADRSTLLLALFPASFVFSLVYAEGAIITLVAAALLALLRRRFVVAGVLAAVATATAPVALAVVVSCAWSAGREIRRDRNWSALAAPLLAPVGFVSYQLWLWWHTGDLWAWRQTELGGWRSYISAAYPVHVVTSFIGHPLGATATIDIVFAGLVLTVVGTVVALRSRLPMPVLLYGLSVAAIAILTRPVGPRPRFLMVAFPLVVAVATRLRGKPYIAVVSASTVLLVALTIYTVSSYAVFP